MSAFTPSPEQAAIIEAPAQDDILVVAGAGSGKTFTMTQRIIALINRGVAPERILGLTFTRKATGELLERVSAAVSAQDETALALSDRAFLKPAIFTYDAFFQTIVRQYGLLVGFDQNTQPLSEAGALQLATEVIDQHMNLAFSEDFGAFGTLANRVLALSNAIGSAMIGAGCTGFEDAIARVRQWDDGFIATLQRALDGETMPDSEPKIASIKRTKKDTDADWQVKLDGRAKQLHSRCVFHCGELLDSTRKRNVLLQLVEAYAQAKRERNMAEFSDFTIAAYQLIERFPSIGERTRRRYSHVLLDEYQDTSTTQAALLSTLFHVNATDRSAVNAVGDPFQSIYAWRGASPGAFRMFQQDFQMPAGSKPFPLSVTRRNSRIVLEAANDLTLPLRSRPARPSSSLMREVDVSSLEAMPTAPEGTLGVLGYATAGQEIDAVVRFCTAVVAKHRRPSTDAWEADTPQNAGPTPVAVLFRSKSHMPEYQAALEQAGLTTFVVGYSALLERPEIRDTLALLHVVADHTDSGSLMRLLATPRFDMSAKDLTALAHIAEDKNTEQRFQALVQAGIAPADTPIAQRAAVVREHRDQVANAVFLPDLLMRGDCGKLLDRLSERGRQSAIQVSAMLRSVHNTIGRPLNDVVRAAIEALDLDIDTVLASAINHPQQRIDPTRAHMPTGAIVDLVDAYTQEIAAEQTPTLRGFMAWVDRLSSVEDEAASLPNGPVDVELMTVHQSKGLEWDAVAVVGMTATGFPSNQGDHLKVTMDEGHPGGTEQGQWVVPEYQETADSWLINPTAVPVPMRVDAGILPRFPHDADTEADPIQTLDALADVEIIDDEVFGSMREFGDGVDEVDPSSWYLTQAEEYGRRLHADERRLAYVALTRARQDALLTYSQRSGEPSRDPSQAVSGSRSAKPSNFWLEVHDALHSHDHVVSAQDCVEQLGDQAALISGSGAPIAPPEGFFVGEQASEYCDEVVGAAWRTPLETRHSTVELPWPSMLDADITERLNRGVGAVRKAIRKLEETSSAAEQLAEQSAEQAGKSAGATIAHAHAHARQAIAPAADPEPLLQQAQLLVDDPDLLSGTLEGDALDQSVQDKAQRILAAGRQNVTSLQARVGGMSKAQQRTYWRGIVRPIPRVASPAAEAGTRFHDWAERFVNAGKPDEAVFVANGGTFSGIGGGSDTGGTSGLGGSLGSEDPSTRETMLADLAEREQLASGASSDSMPLSAAASAAAASATAEPAMRSKTAFESADKDLLLWQRRLADSRWAKRMPVWAERSIVVNVPGIGIVNGKLDAVFAGGLDPQDDAKRFTVVDWKTGHRPTRPNDIAQKLAQLDMYRLLLAAVEDVELDSIDATLYYVSEPEEGSRELHARDKTEQEILTELSSGIPEQSDND